jgi:hypothetical protein
MFKQKKQFGWGSLLLTEGTVTTLLLIEEFFVSIHRAKLAKSADLQSKLPFRRDADYSVLAENFMVVVFYNIWKIKLIYVHTCGEKKFWCSVPEQSLHKTVLVSEKCVRIRVLKQRCLSLIFACKSFIIRNVFILRVTTLRIFHWPHELIDILHSTQNLLRNVRKQVFLQLAVSPCYVG